MNEPINGDDKEFVSKYWQIDKEDADQDADLIQFLGGKVPKKKKKSKSSRSKTIVEQPQQQNTSIQAQNEEPKQERQTSPKRFTRIITELNLNSQRREIPSPLKTKQKSQVLIEEPVNSPLIHLNPSAPETTTAQQSKKYHASSNSLSGQLNYYKYRPSFNAGAPFFDQQQQSMGGSIETNNNTVKLSEFVSRKSTKNPSALPFLPNQGDHQNLPNALLLPLKQYADQETLDDYDVETTKYSSNIHPTLSKVRTPHQSSTVAPTTWGELNLGQGRSSPMKDFQERVGRTYESPTQMLGDNSPNFARRPQNRQSQSVIQPVPLQPGQQILHVPLLQYNLQPTTNLNDGQARRSLVRLPIISTSKGNSMDMSPGKGSPLVFDKTPMGSGLARHSSGNINPLSREQNGSPFLVERKLSRFMSNGHGRGSGDLSSVFKASATRQLQEFAN